MKKMTKKKNSFPNKFIMKIMFISSTWVVFLYVPSLKIIHV